MYDFEELRRHPPSCPAHDQKTCTCGADLLESVPGHDVTDVDLGNRILERVGKPVAPYRQALTWLEEHQHLPALLASIYLEAGPLASTLLHEMAMELVRAKRE